MLAFLAFNNFIIEHWSQCIFHNSVILSCPIQISQQFYCQGTLYTLHNLVKWSAAKKDMLCSAMSVVKYISAAVTLSSSYCAVAAVILVWLVLSACMFRCLTILLSTICRLISWTPPQRQLKNVAENKWNFLLALLHVVTLPIILPLTVSLGFLPWRKVIAMHEAELVLPQ